jgi:predicted enzyme related to lactoylglutathione lyase
VSTRATGLGGVFVRAKDPEQLMEWYERHLGLKREDGAILFRWRHQHEADRPGTTVFSLFPKDTTYFGTNQQSMINLRVEDLDAVLAALTDEGIPTLGQEDTAYGRFAWVEDGEGNRVELWEPKAGE